MKRTWGGTEGNDVPPTVSTGPSGNRRQSGDPRPEETSTRDLLAVVGDDIVLDLTGAEPRIEFSQRSLVLDESRPPLHQRLCVRLFDLTGAAIGIGLLAPLLVVVGLAVRVSSPGPVFFASRRVGQDGQPFEAYKFRSMNADAEQRLAEHLASDPQLEAEYARAHKLRRDPRVTSIGHFLRRTSLDELPQLFNVLRGEMSLVGPRPKLLNEPDRYGPAMTTVLRVKPGLTGLWQVSGRNDLTFDERIVLDVEYATTRTMTGDLEICARTVAQLLQPSKHGAY